MTSNNTAKIYRSNTDSGAPAIPKSLLKLEFVLPPERLEMARNQSEGRPDCDSEDVEMRNVVDQKFVVQATNEISENDRNGKKKESANKFYCDGFPPCKQSFTRSEHLARHIRRHTGERPFECYCSQKFSRLDNLRQHVQTVHQNEEIPEDSLAATGFKHQRKLRKDRPRASGTRARGNTTGSQTGPIRGHKKNSWSTSSISSSGSVYSCNLGFDKNLSNSVMVASNDHPGLAPRRSGQAKGPLTCQVKKLPDSPMRLNTPLTPRSNSNISESPAWTFGHHPSPTLLDYIPDRRLSVPSSASNLKKGVDKTLINSPFAATGFITSSPLFSQIGSSPISKVTNKGEAWPSKDSTVITDESARRRTWHPDTYSMYTRGAQHLKTFNIPQDRLPDPSTVSNKASPAPLVRLPGIESFFQCERPRTPLKRETDACATTFNSQATWHAQIRNRELNCCTYEHDAERDRRRFESNKQEGINSWICGSRIVPMDTTRVMSGSNDAIYEYNTEPSYPYTAERSASYYSPVYSRGIYDAAPRSNTQNLEAMVSASSNIRTQQKPNTVMTVSP